MFKTHGGELNSTTTRFWLGLIPEQAAQLLHQFLVAELGEDNIRVQSTHDKITMFVNKSAGQKTVQGTFVIRSNDSIQAEGQTLVVMYRSKVSRDNLPSLK
jgi:serine/threonine-protein kinase Chk1